MSENHLMVFLHSDGFTERLLNVKIFMTQSNKYEVYLRCFQKGNDYGSFRHEFESGPIPEAISEFLEAINQTEELDFGFTKSEEYAWTDSQRQEILFFHNGKTKGIHITDGMTSSSINPENDLGKRLYDLYKYLNNWKEEIYDNFCNDRI